MKHINPSDGVVEYIGETDLNGIEAIVGRAREAQDVWSSMTLKERIARLTPIKELIEQNIDDISRSITLDIGKPLSQSRGEIIRATDKVKLVMKSAPKILKPNKFNRKNITYYDPVGTVVILSPWNYPFSTTFLSIIPALLCGNSVIVKMSEYSPRTGMAINRLFQSLDIPKEVFSMIIGGPEHGKKVVTQDVDMISFTGSTAVGKDIVKETAERLPKLVLELGGLDSAIVLKDADVDKAAAGIIRMSYWNSGQICCAIKRVYVEEDISEQFIEAIVRLSKALTVGNPLEDVDMGPLSSKAQLEKIESIVEDALSKGAKALSGGKKIESEGYHYPHTILVDIKKDMRVINEEPFGPILPIMPVKDWKEAVKQANSTRYGLCSSVWTKNLKSGEEVAQQLAVGIVGINAHGGGPFGTPWGGIKESGIGRLNSEEGFRSFTEPKLIHKQKL